MNGVTGSVLQALKHLSSRGHELLVIAPNAGRIDADLYGAHTHLVRSIPFPGYPEVRMVFARTATIAGILEDFGPDVVHLASPFTLGWAGVRAARSLGIPSVAVYQTDVTAYAEKYGIPGGAPIVASHISRIHRSATLTLAPSSSATQQLTELGVDRLRTWGRGVDADRFAPERRSESWRDSVAHGRQIIGYVGRLAPEKQVEDLQALSKIPGACLVIVGDGPSRAELESLLPDAHFTGQLGGDALAEAMASFDVFVHPGEAETFCQTVQEAHASGVPVVATGKGGPVDLVQVSVNGCLYEPGNLDDMRERVEDLLGDHAKRASFARAARLAVRSRTWSALCDELVDLYVEAIELNRLDLALLARGTTRPERLRSAPTDEAAVPRWSRYVALGDSITEGIGDSSRMPAGEHLGWAARLAMLLTEHKHGTPLHFANFAVRSRRVEHLTEQVDRALELKPDLVSVLMGSNDLVRARVDIANIAARLEAEVSRLRAANIEVLLGTPFLPRRRAAKVLAGRFAEYNAHIRRIALAQRCALLDVEAIPEIGDLDMWAEDRVHLTSAGHRLLAYHAASVLGVPNAEVLSSLEQRYHEEPFKTRTLSEAEWITSHVLPWMWRRVRGRTAGDGIMAKHDDYLKLDDTVLREFGRGQA